MLGLSLYWQSVWGHRKGDYKEKGFVQALLNDDDASALSFLDRLDEEL